jgi:uncharacterized protein (DUF433 family)
MIHDRGRGPELIGTRITVYNLMPYFLDPACTEDAIARLYKLTAEQVAAVRAYALNNAERVMSRHREIEARNAAGNPPEVVEQMKKAHSRLMEFKEWLARRQTTIGGDHENGSRARREESSRSPLFDEWKAQHPSETPEPT